MTIQIDEHFHVHVILDAAVTSNVVIGGASSAASSDSGSGESTAASSQETERETEEEKNQSSEEGSTDSSGNDTAEGTEANLPDESSTDGEAEGEEENKEEGTEGTGADTEGTGNKEETGNGVEEGAGDQSGDMTDQVLGGDMGDVSAMMGQEMETGTEKPQLMANWYFVIGISGAVFVVGGIIGFILAKRRIKKGIELYED